MYMDDLDKIRVILPHWIEHNLGHGKEFAKWADVLVENGREDLAILLKKAEASLKDADSSLKEALQKTGGALEGHQHGHHHHHHKSSSE